MSRTGVLTQVLAGDLMLPFTSNPSLTSGMKTCPINIWSVDGLLNAQADG